MGTIPFHWCRGNDARPPIPRSSHATVIPANSFQHQKWRRCTESQGAGWFPSQAVAVIPSFCGRRKSSVQLCFRGRKITHRNVCFITFCVNYFFYLNSAHMCCCFFVQIASLIFFFFLHSMCFTCLNPSLISLSPFNWSIREGYFSSTFTWQVCGLTEAIIPHVRWSHTLWANAFFWKLINDLLYAAIKHLLRPGANQTMCLCSISVCFHFVWMFTSTPQTKLWKPHLTLTCFLMFALFLGLCDDYDI